MTAIFERVQAALDTIVPAVSNACGIFLTDDGQDLPDLYLVFTLVSSVPAQHAGNAETERGEMVQISIYSRDGLTNLPDVDGAMRAAGFMKGDARQLPFDEGTRHFGLAIDYFIT